MSEPVPPPAPFLSVIVPFFNEAENAEKLVEEVTTVLGDYRGMWELLCVDDGSDDGTAERLERKAATVPERIRVLRLRRNFGQTAALQAGIDASRGELIAMLDGDLQNDPADLPRMVDELLERDLDLLTGWRRNRQDGYFLRLLPSKIANALIRRVTGVRIRDYGCGTKVFRGEVLRRIRLFGEMHRFIPVWIAGVTAPSRIGETPVHHRPRTGGRSKYGLSRAFRVLPDLLAVFFFLRYRARPGHFFGSIGIAFGVIGTAIMAWLLIAKLGFGQDIGDRPLLLFGVLALVFSIQFLTTGVLAELLARTYFESPRAPSYLLAPGSEPPGQHGERPSSGGGSPPGAADA
ncbi:glycosyl transferase, family 2 [Thioalkalivibrio nitratireducens DSM 14787]|uniref:Glycosyl transferase, family 2 n=1 Tax=Thioalkalivibrio nitratireducens (strain DSM 14787 / UNIQEM 213 / ALEN2) TaxID=1255043 RepID=L0DZZ9_THIND|nr:glycosyltransferase family 2 protein [Thioalkalivibrio nitratireducens]AGA35174.1 glycosyl transferase, family 2 [Thioalkalivibrio nitratireducens DSM 14787]